MAYVTPRTWSPGETVTAALFNQHIRDNMNVLKTQIRDDGRLLTLLKGIAFSAGQGNAAGGGDTALTSYLVTIPAGLISQPGDGVVLEGSLSAAANTNTKALKLKLVGAGAPNMVTVFTNAANVANHIPTFRLLLRRRTATVGAATGASLVGAANQGNATSVLLNAGLTGIDWSIDQTLTLYLVGTAANDLLMVDYCVRVFSGLTGSIV